MGHSSCVRGATTLDKIKTSDHGSSYQDHHIYSTHWSTCQLAATIHSPFLFSSFHSIILGIAVLLVLLVLLFSNVFVL